MDDDKLNDKAHPPTSSPQQNDNFLFWNMIENENTGSVSDNARLIGRNSATYPPDQFSATSSSWRQAHGNNQTNPKAPFDTSNNLAVGLNQPPNFQYPTNIAGNVPNPYQQYYPPPQRDNIINVHPQFGQNPRLNRNFPLNRGNNAEVIDLSYEDDNGQLGNNFHGPGSGKNVFYQPQDAEVTSSFNQNQINSSQLGSSGRADEIRRSIEYSWFKNNMGGLPSSQNSMGGLHSSQNNMGRLTNPQNSMGRLPSSPNIMGRLPNSQIKLGVFPSVRDRMGGLPSSQNNMGALANSQINMGGLPSSQIHRLHTPPVQMGGVSNPPPGFSTSDAAQKFYQQEWLTHSERIMAARRYMESRFNRDFSGQVPNPINSAAQAGQVPNPINSAAQAGNKDAQLRLRIRNQLATQVPNTTYCAAQAFEEAKLRWRRRNELARQTVQTPQNYGHPLVSNPHGNPSLKRGSSHPNPSSSRVQRRRTKGQYQASSRPQTPPVSAAQIPTPRGGSVEGPIEIPCIPPQAGNELKPCGYQCMLCKRDLAFPPEGPIEQPSNPPQVAVLPCQHTFHDSCLELITPEDQKTNPPCIPCAMGEK